MRLIFNKWVEGMAVFSDKDGLNFVARSVADVIAVRDGATEEKPFFMLASDAKDSSELAKTALDAIKTSPQATKIYHTLKMRG